MQISSFSYSRSKRIILFSLVALSLSFALFRERWLMLTGDFLIIQDTLEPADVIHVIAGDDYRTDYAFQLYQQGYGKTVFFTGGWCDIHLYEHGTHAREKALLQGLPLDSIASDDSAVMSTYMEAERLKEWIASSASPVRSIIVVSDPFHMRRARWTYQKVFGNQVQIQMAPVPFEFTPYQSVWWKDVDSRKYVEEEYLKYVFYMFRYEYSWGVFKDWLATFDKM
jgi:uncharacterized SAM-binding protein YcdF (DUF218 family)